MGKPFITREGFDYLHKELDYLWEVKRPEITQKVSWAASLGDRSENADYHYNKRLLAQIDRRIRYLRHCLADLQVIEYNKQQDDPAFCIGRKEFSVFPDCSRKYNHCFSAQAQHASIQRHIRQHVRKNHAVDIAVQLADGCLQRHFPRCFRGQAVSFPFFRFVIRHTPSSTGTDSTAAIRK